MQTAPLLIEIGTEELPPVRLDRLGQSWLESLQLELEKNNIPFGQGFHYVAPRRIALLIDGIPQTTQAKKVQRKGPALQAAFDADGKPTQAALGFARSNNTTVESLETLETEKGSWLIFDATIEGQSAKDFMPELVKRSLEKLPIGKKMRWGNEPYEFIRPVHWCVALHGDTVLPFDIFGIPTGNQSRGHRFHHPEPVMISHASQYLDVMRNAHVIADYQERKNSIVENTNNLASSIQATAKIDEDLLDLVTGLNEWPTPILAHFEPSFLNVPQEALITAMQHHQKCFPLLDMSGKLLPTFVLTANTSPMDPGLIIHGNERVMHARLSDAQFFFTQDCKKPLESHQEGLGKMIFQKKLGSLLDKTNRVKKLAKTIASLINAPAHHAERAGTLSKCDLLTEMVGEFPELQGIMGYYYALAGGETPEVAVAIKESYLPKFSGDNLPESQAGLCLSLADKLDTLVGIFGIGKIPTGDKDPFGLRRSCLGILRILVEKSLALDLKNLISEAVSGYRSSVSDDVIPDILAFCFERFRAWYQDKGVNPKTIDAVFAIKTPSNPLDFSKRIEAVNHFQNLPESEALASANKRVRNILSKSGATINFNINPEINTSALAEPAESELYETLERLKERTSPFLAESKYTETLNELAQLKTSVDNFFEHVMVNVEDEPLRQNRINLLTNLHNLFGQVADISRLS